MYILFYSIFYFFTKLEITEFIPTLMYLGYTGKVLILIKFFKNINFLKEHKHLAVVFKWVITLSPKNSQKG